MSIARTAVVAVAAALAAGSVLAAPMANAAPAPKGTAGLHAHLPAAAMHGAKLATVPTTYYGAGYFNYPGEANGVASANVTFKMPTISCAHQNDSEWLLPGIWVYDGSGNLSQQVDVNFNCNSGALLQEGIICISTGSCDTSLVVSPGDRIQASIYYTPSATVGTLHNLTTGVSTQVTGTAVTTDYTVFIGDEGPSLFAGGAVTKVPTFRTVTFSDAYVNGQSIADNINARYHLKTGTPIQITAGPLTGDGNGFVSTFKHN